jgi:hypothetical protein
MQFKTGTGVRKVKLQFEVTVELTYQRYVVASTRQMLDLH